MGSRHLCVRVVRRYPVSLTWVCLMLTVALVLTIWEASS